MIKRLIQKTAIGLAIGTAAVTATAAPIITSVFAENVPSAPNYSEDIASSAWLSKYNEKDIIDFCNVLEYMKVALENNLWNDDYNDTNHGQVSFKYEGITEVADEEEAKSKLAEDLFNTYKATSASRNGSDQEVLLHAYRFITTGNNGEVHIDTYSSGTHVTSGYYTRTTKFIFEGDKEHPELEDLVDKTDETGSELATTYIVLEGELVPKGTGKSHNGRYEFKEVDIPEIEGWKIKNTKNTEATKDFKKGSFEAEVVYVPIEEDNNTGENFDNYDDALKALKEYAESKDVEPKVVDLGKKEYTEENDTRKDEIQRIIDIYKDIIENGKDPVIYIETLFLNETKKVTRDIEIVDEEGNTLQKSIKQEVTLQQGGTNTYLTENGLTGDGPIIKNPDPKYPKTQMPEIDGYIFVKSENTDEKKASTNETGKLIYKKTENKDEEKTDIITPTKTPSNYNEALDMLKEYAAKKGKTIKMVDLGDKIITDEKEIEKEEKRLMALYENMIKNNKEPIIYTEEFTIDNSEYSVRTIRFVDEDGNELKAPEEQKVMTTSSASTTTFGEDGETAKSYATLTDATYAKLEAPAIDGYEILEENNTGEKKAEEDEEGKIVYRKVSAKEELDASVDTINDTDNNFTNEDNYISDDSDEYVEDYEDDTYADDAYTDDTYTDEYTDNNTPDTGNATAIPGIVGALAGASGLLGLIKRRKR